MKDIATKSLGEWTNPDAGPALLEIVKTDADVKYQVRAMRGYIRIARQLSLSDDDRLAMFQLAMATAKRNEEKQIALDILTRIPSPKTLQVAVASLEDPALKNAAAAAAVKIAEKIVSSSPKPVAEGMKKSGRGEGGRQIGRTGQAIPRTGQGRHEVVHSSGILAYSPKTGAKNIVFCSRVSFLAGPPSVYDL